MRRGEPVDYARRAVELGLAEIGFSDHSPMRRDDFDNWRMHSTGSSTNTSKKSGGRKRIFRS